MPALKIAAVYVRVSTDDQTELSPASQLETIRAWAEEHGYLIPDANVFMDEGISGRSAAKRPQFVEMVAQAKSEAHPFDAILVWKFSRFARNQEESILYKTMLRRCGVVVLSVSEPIAEDVYGSLIERIVEWMDEFYSIRLSGEVKRSMTLNARRGRRQIPAPFGYRLTPPDEDGKRRMEPDPAEAPLVREIFARFIGGEGLFPIARSLNEQGVTTHRGSAFENRTVEYILCNPVYKGMIRWTPTGKTRRDFSNPDTITAPGDHEALVSAETWEAAQTRLRAVKEQWKYKARPSTELKDWLSGVVRCADCGATLIFSKPHFFKCNNYARGRCRSTQHIHVDLLHDAVLEKLRADLQSAAPLSYELAITSDGSADEIRRLQLAQEQQERKLARVREAYASGVESLEDYRKWREEISAEQQRLSARITELQSRLSPERAAAQLHKSIASALETLEAPDTTKEQKNAAVRSLFHSCTFDKSKMLLTIIYRISI